MISVAWLIKPQITNNFHAEIVKNMSERFYFETSAVNFLYELFSKDKKHSSVKTKALQLSKGRKCYISTVTLWEIFKTKDENLRYDLYDFILMGSDLTKSLN